MNQSHIVDKKQPNGSRVASAQLKPLQGTIESAKKDGLAQGASDIEKVMPKLEWPSNQSECVND